MTYNEFDLEQFADLFDQAMTSDNPTVKRAFKNLLMVAAITESDEKKVVGPMREPVSYTHLTLPTIYSV